MRRSGDDAEAVRDHEDRDVAFALYILGKLQMLSLDSGIQRRSRLVGDDELRLAGQGDGAAMPRADTEDQKSRGGFAWKSGSQRRREPILGICVEGQISMA